jgi:hypothetical protein
MLEKARLRLETRWNRWNQSGGNWPKEEAELMIIMLIVSSNRAW